MIRIPRKGDLMRLTEVCGTTELDGVTELQLPVGTLLRVEWAIVIQGRQGFQIMVEPVDGNNALIGEFFFLDQADRDDGLITAEFA